MGSLPPVFALLAVVAQLLERSAAGAAAAAAASSCPSFATYNVCEGNLSRAHVELLRRAAPPGAALVVAFNELNGFDGTRFGARMREWGRFAHSAFLAAPTGYHLGLASDLPLSRVRRHRGEASPFHHGMLRATVGGGGGGGGGLVAAVVHLSPRSAVARLAEVRELLRLRGADAAQSERGAAAPWVLLGDLNSLSTDDAAHYAEEGTGSGSGGADGGGGATLRALRSTPSLRRKFLAPGGEVDYAPFDALVLGGWLDLMGAQQQQQQQKQQQQQQVEVGAQGAAAGQAGAAVVASGGGLQHTVPTASCADAMHAARLRLDYVLTDHVAAAQGATCQVLRGPLAEQMSDHFPVLCDNVCHVDA